VGGGGFSDDLRLQAAELVAFDVLEPALRSRGGIGEAARALSKDDNFRTRMDRLFRGQPSGRLTLPALGQLADQVADLERRLASIEQQLRDPGRDQTHAREHQRPAALEHRAAARLGAEPVATVTQ
jgi:hypothetical protein